jgi:hypothetical protein
MRDVAKPEAVEMPLPALFEGLASDVSGVQHWDVVEETGRKD